MTTAETQSAAVDRDVSAELCDVVRAAHNEGRTLLITGGGSKQQLVGRRCDAPALDVRAHRGIVSYRPEEMLITARSGTPIRELISCTAARGQRLPFEPGDFSGRATLGGTLATGLSGPARPWCGSVRDAVLGLRLVNGVGEHLRFGGEVMKNVAGYDVSRLQSGALGTLGLITEVSLRLLPIPQETLSLQRQCSAQEALSRMRALALRPLPLSGACWLRDTLYLRFAGSSAAVHSLRRDLEDYSESSEPPWEPLREWSLAELAQEPLWGMDVAPATAVSALAPPLLIDWAGARRYSSANLDLAEAQKQAGAAGGYATRYGAGDRDIDVVADPIAPLQQLQQRIKHALDPAGVFNPGRLYRWL